MNMLVSFLVSLFLTASTVAWAEDLGMAGALSGFGQGMGQGLESMQGAIIQQGLMQERARMDRERQERQYQHELEMQRLRYDQERGRAEYQRKLSEQSQLVEYQWLTTEKARLDQQKARLDREADSPSHRQRLLDYNTQGAEYTRRAIAYHQRMGIPERVEDTAVQQAFENARAELLRQQAANPLADQIATERATARESEYQYKSSYPSRLEEYQQLMIEKDILDQQKEMLKKEADSPERQRAITEYNRQVLEYQTRQRAFNQRRGDLSPAEGARTRAAVESRAASSK